MSMALKKDYSIQDLESRYHEITALYDLSNELIETVLDKSVDDADAQMAAVEPLASEVLEATDILTEEYIMLSRGVRNKNLQNISKTKMESAIRRIYGAVNAYREHMKNTPGLLKNLKNVADAVVNKIQRQVERVIAVVVEFVQLSLSSLMGKAELELLRVREANVALMMHRLSQQSQ